MVRGITFKMERLLKKQFVIYKFCRIQNLKSVKLYQLSTVIFLSITVPDHQYFKYSIILQIEIKNV